jgi:hypothetical protein
MRGSLLSLAIVAAVLVGCSDTPSPTQVPFTAAPPQHLATVSGKVAPNSAGYKGTALMLQQDDGSTIGLLGDQAAAMYSVVDDQVEVDGLLDETGQMLVQRFIVMAVGGEAVLDGVLDLTPDGFIIRLTRGGDRGVIDPSDDLQQHIGDRIWLAGPDDAAPTAFGVITSVTHDTDVLQAAGRGKKKPPKK